MIDVAILAKDVAAYLIPALPYLMKASEEAVKEVGKKIGGEALDYAKSLWARLRPKAEATPALQGAIVDVAAAPDDEDAQAQLRHQLKKLLADDTKLASELNGILQDAKNAGVTVIVSGDRSVGIGGNVSGSTIITGDQNHERRRTEKE
jgi:3-hydroxyacyl-CoA dehydrogenase